MSIHILWLLSMITIQIGSIGRTTNVKDITGRVYKVVEFLRYYKLYLNS